MKIRIHNNLVRLRLSQNEVSQVARGVEIREELKLPDQNPSFSYSLKPFEKDDDLSINFVEQHLSINLPASEIKKWANTEQVGITKTIPVSEDVNLQVLIEKDFQCLHKRPGEDEKDNFPNPQA